MAQRSMLSVSPPRGTTSSVCTVQLSVTTRVLTFDLVHVGFVEKEGKSLYMGNGEIASHFKMQAHTNFLISYNRRTWRDHLAQEKDQAVPLRANTLWRRWP